MFPRIDNPKKMVVDVETTGLKWWSDRLFGIALCTEDHNTWYFDVRTAPNVTDWLNDFIANTDCTWIGHNLKFDYHFLREFGILLPADRIDCTMTRAALISEHEPTYELDFLARKYANTRKDSEIYDEMANLFGGRATRNGQMPNITR